MKIKIEIKHFLTDAVLFEFEKENNTLKDTLIEGVKCGANLCNANLCNANLCGANLRNANLRGANLRNANLRNANLRGANLRGANLYGANLCNANLCGANLRGANLYGADLCNADLCNADLCNANLCGANLCGANLYGADLCNAYLCNADLCNANLCGANLCNANLRGANLRNVDLCNAKNVPFIPFSCPSDGAFIGWKKINNYKESYEGSFLVKLEIPKDARRCSATSYKCRCDKARVLAINRIEDGKNVDIITNTDYDECVYKVGELVIPNSFDEDRWNECSNGIHFFINKQQAIDY